MTRVWLRVRLAIYALGVAQGVAELFYPILTESPFPASSFTVAASLIIFLPVAMLSIIGLQIFNPSSAATWTAPSHYSNPFDLRDPLHLFHMMGFHQLAQSIGLVGAAIVSGRDFYDAAVVLSAMGIGLLVSVPLCMRVFRSKFAS